MKIDYPERWVNNKDRIYPRDLRNAALCSEITSDLHNLQELLL